MTNCTVLLTVYQISILNLETHTVCREEGVRLPQGHLCTLSLKGPWESKHGDGKAMPQCTAELLQQVSWSLWWHLASGHSLWKATQQNSPDVLYWRIEVDRKVELNIKGFNFVSSILIQTKSCI